MPDSEQHLYGISEINTRARSLLECNFATVAVYGEIANHKVVSGHHYFTLRDSKAQLAGVLFRQTALRCGMRLRSGIEVEAWGKLTIYQPYGRYQLVIDKIRARGIGDLHAQYEELKNKLRLEGVFDANKKRNIPLLPGRVAVVSSPQGAVIRDIVTVAKRRFNNPNIVLLPSAVQGSTAVQTLCRQIDRASTLMPPVDLIIIARGGGSLEDLWAFNEEPLVRAVERSPIPVVSAVGHETDTTLCDLVADLRAPTPSAAAELVWPEQQQLKQHIAHRAAQLDQALSHRLTESHYRLSMAASGLADWEKQLQNLRQRLQVDHMVLRERLIRLHQERRKTLNGKANTLTERAPQVKMAAHRTQLTHQYIKLRHHLKALIIARKSTLHSTQKSQSNALHTLLARRHSALSVAATALHARSPLAVLERGYSIVSNSSHKAIDDSAMLKTGDSINVRLHRGSIEATVATVTTSGNGE